MTDLIGAIDYLLKDAVDVHVVLGPAQWWPDDPNEFYFMVAVCGPEGFRCDRFQAETRADILEVRGGVKGALIFRKPRVIHDCDDELYMARLCERLWPGERITRLRKTVERERAERAAALQ